MQRHSKLTGIIGIAIALACGFASLASAQVAPASVPGAAFGAFVSFGGQKTRVNSLNYNSLGFDGGLFLQKSTFVGFEARYGNYWMYARFPQAPLTAGYRVAVRQSSSHRFQPFGYVGGGISRSVQATPDWVTLPAEWSPCFQVSQGLNIPVRRHWQWKAYEATFTDTFDSQRALPAFTLTTGITYTFRR